MQNLNIHEIAKNAIIVILAVILMYIPNTKWFSNRFPEKTLQRFIFSALYPFIFFGIVIIGGIYLQRMLRL